MLVSVCWVGGFESEVQTNNSRGIHVCQRFFSISKQCDFIICDVLLERLSVRLAEGSYLLNFFYIFFETAFFLGASKKERSYHDSSDFG